MAEEPDDEPDDEVGDPDAGETDRGPPPAAADEPTPSDEGEAADDEDSHTDGVSPAVTDESPADPPASDPDSGAGPPSADGTPAAPPQATTTAAEADTLDDGDDDPAHAGDDDPAHASDDRIDDPDETAQSHAPGVPEDVRTYDRFTKIDGSTYERANEFLRDRTYITAREWAIARLCADFRTETGVEMTKIGEHLPELVPFMTDTYTPQAVNQARASFEEKVRKSGATFLYGAMSDFFAAEELDDVMYEATEVAKFLLEVEGVDLSVEEELAAEDQISEVMREVREHSAALRHDDVVCPECGHEIRASED